MILLVISYDPMIVGAEQHRQIIARSSVGMVFFYDAPVPIATHRTPRSIGPEFVKSSLLTALNVIAVIRNSILHFDHHNLDKPINLHVRVASGISDAIENVGSGFEHMFLAGYVVDRSSFEGGQ